MTRVLCVHGRGQHGKDPDELRRKWATGLRAGLAAAGRGSVDSGTLVFPFYGDLLEARKLQAVRAGADLDLESGAVLQRRRMSPLLPEEVAEVESDLLRSPAEQAGVDEIQLEGWEERVLRIPGARRLLEAVADRTDVEQEIIEAFLTDVAVYFRVARTDVLDTVRATVPVGQESLVIVAHSLGGVVALDLLEDDAVRDRTVLLVALGSPLGQQACHRNLLAGGPVHPGNRAHAIENYLGDRRVAGRIAEALHG